MTNDQLLTELIDALRKLNIAPTDAAKNHYTARAAELETALRAQLAQAQPLLDAAADYAHAEIYFTDQFWLDLKRGGLHDSAVKFVNAQAALAAKG